jgi:RNA polymerase sigma factor (sigma-70 family)
MADLVALLTPILWHTVRAQRVSTDAAEDVLQATWLALVRNGRSIVDSRAVLQWMIVTARREAWRVVRQANRVQPHKLDERDLDNLSDDSPERLVVQSDADARLWQHVARLPEKCRQLLRVIAFGDRPDYASIAAALGMPVGSIGPTRGRCLAKLRASLSGDAQWAF